MTNRFRLVCDSLVPSSKFLCHWHWDRNKIVLFLETNNFDPKNPKHHLKWLGFKRWTIIFDQTYFWVYEFWFYSPKKKYVSKSVSHRWNPRYNPFNFSKKNVPVILWHCDKSMAVIFLQLIENISTVESVTFWHPRKIRARKKPPHLKKKTRNSLIYKTKEKIMRYGREGEGS